MEFLAAFIDAGRNFAPHGYCLLWQPELVWTHVVADALIAGAYFSIPLALITLMRRRRDLDFGWIFWLFATFIVACGLTHVMAIWTLWNADYALEAVLKVVTAIASVGTAIVLWPLIPRLVALPSPSQLQERNAQLESTLAQLQHEMQERRRAEDALRQAQKMEAVGQLTGGIAHDFNNLLQSVSGSLALIARSPTSEKVAIWADLGRQAAERGARLTAQLLAFSRVQKLELQAVRVAPLVAGMKDLLASAVGSARTIVLDVDDASDAQVMGDPTQIELAIINLSINARDAMPQGGTIRIRIAPRTLAGDAMLPDGRYLALSVSDTGCGMDAETAARAFDPFFTTKDVGKGTGLGLSMVYGVARQSGGHAAIRSAPGAGTTVEMLLPLVEGPQGGPGPSRPPVANAALRVLVVDDDDDVRLMTVSMLEELGHRVREADGGAAALAMLESDPPDLIVLDYAMPGMNGAEVATAIRRRGIAAAIVFATGFANMDAIKRALEREPYVLRKPYDLAELSAMMRRATADMPA